MILEALCSSSRRRVHHAAGSRNASQEAPAAAGRPCCKACRCCGLACGLAAGFALGAGLPAARPTAAPLRAQPQWLLQRDSPQVAHCAGAKTIGPPGYLRESLQGPPSDGPSQRFPWLRGIEPQLLRRIQKYEMFMSPVRLFLFVGVPS